jgi:PAS domain S-box-containing protein
MSGSIDDGREREYQALRDSEELHRATLSSISDAVFLTDDAGAFTFVCPNVDVIFGYVPDEVHAMGHLQRLLGECPVSPRELKRRGEVPNVEREVTTKSGERRVLLVQYKSVAIRASTVLCTCRDITDLKQAERELAATRLELAHGSRLALVGVTTAAIVEDLSQPLSAIRTNAGAGRLILDRKLTRIWRSELRDIFSDLQNASRDAGEILGRLRTLVRKRPPILRPVNLNRVVQDVLLVVAADARRRSIALRSEVAAPLPAVRGDRVSLQQVLLKLVLNAMDAVEVDGHRGEKAVVVRTRMAETEVECAVSDTGHGISSDNLTRIFEPFFTTKESSVGLGLAIARSLVQAHAGRLWAESSPAGATFRLALPTTAASAPPT